MNKAMKVFIWYGNQDGNGYDKPREQVKVYAVAEDLAGALRQIDKLLAAPNVQGAEQMRRVVRNNKPQVFAVPFAEINIARNGRAVAVVAAGEEGGGV